MQPVDERSRGSARFAGLSSAGLLVLVLGALGLAVGIGLAAAPLQALDRAVADGLNALVAPRPALVAALEAVTDLGATGTAVVVLATLAAALLVRGQRRLAAYVAVTGLGGAVLGPAVKELVGRLRPVVETPVATAGGASFPSGHALTSTVLVGVLLLVLLPVLPGRARRPAVAAGVTVVVLVGVTRLALGVHFLTDVVGGWGLGIAWLAVTSAAFRSWRRRIGLPAGSGGLAPETAPELAPAPDHEPGAPQMGTAAAQLLVTAVLLLGVLLAMGRLLTATAVGRGIGEADVAAVRWLSEHRTPAVNALSVALGELGNTLVVIVLGLVVAILALAALRRWRPVLILAVGLVGELLLFLAATAIINRPRPPVTHLDAELPPTSSFPSGHTGAAICLYGGVAVLVLGATRAWWRWLVVAAAVTIVVLVAFARLYRGAHHPTDVLGSVVFALPWLLASRYILRPAPDPADQEPVTARRTSTSA